MIRLKSYVYDQLGSKPRGNLYYLKYEADRAIAEKDAEIAELKGQVNGFQNRSSLWHYNAVEEHKKLVQAGMVIAEKDKEIAKLKNQIALLQAGLTKKPGG